MGTIRKAYAQLATKRKYYELMAPSACIAPGWVSLVPVDFLWGVLFALSLLKKFKKKWRELSITKNSPFKEAVCQTSKWKY